MGARVVVLCLAVAAAAVAARAEPARACSCAVGDPRAMLARADGAFVGSLVERRERGGGEVTLVFRVERAVKGRLGATVAVRTAAWGASCGIELEQGDRTGLVLDRDGNVWRGSLCGQIAPARLLEAARPLPSPDGRGAAALLVGGGFGPVRTIALDRLGRTLAYGRGAGETMLLAVCPGGSRVAEVAALRARIRPWSARHGVAVGGTAYGVGWQGELLRGDLPRGPVRRLRTLPSPVVRAVVAVS